MLETPRKDVDGDSCVLCRTYIQRLYSLINNKSRTIKSKTEAVLQRRSMLKLGVICKYMKRYGKC